MAQTLDGVTDVLNNVNFAIQWGSGYIGDLTLNAESIAMSGSGWTVGGLTFVSSGAASVTGSGSNTIERLNGGFATSLTVDLSGSARIDMAVFKDSSSTITLTGGAWRVVSAGGW